MEEGRRGISRRRFLGVAAGASAAAAAGPFGVSAIADDRGRGRGERLVARKLTSIQQFSVRDSITRLDKSVKGFLGGADFPDDPEDLGPLVDLPGGFAAVLEYLASVGYAGFEFFQFSQGANGPIMTEQIRTALDNAGLKSTGTHTGGLGTMFSATDPTHPGRQAQIEIASVLGHHMIGTAATRAA